MKASDLKTYRRKLPHWRLEGRVYFVTWRLAKTQPCLHPEERTLVADAITHFDGQRYELLAYVVMDDLVHVLAFPYANHSLDKILHSWKSFSAKVIRRIGERTVPVWQDEYFDRIVRDEAELIQKAGYIVGNPVRRWPEIEDYPWVWLGSLE
ncbi:transposase [Thermodesulfobacteriota bacterium]